MFFNETKDALLLFLDVGILAENNFLSKVKVAELKILKCQYLSCFENRFKTGNVKKTIVLLLWTKVKN